MSRELKSIRTFIRGQVSTLDPSDIDDNAAIASIDIDPNIGDGEIRGRKYHTSLASGVLDGARAHAFIDREDGTRDLFYHDSSAGSIKVIKDFEGTTPAADANVVTGLANTKRVTMTPQNQHVHIGITGSDPKWVGYIEDDQFDVVATPTTVVGLDASLEPPDLVPYLYKVLVDVSAVAGQVDWYGIEWQGDKVWKLSYTIATNLWVVTSTATGDLIKTQGLCEHQTDLLYMYVYDGSTHKLHKITRSTLAVDSGLTLDTLILPPNTPGLTISDITATGTDDASAKVWFAVYSAYTWWDSGDGFVPQWGQFLVTINPTAGTGAVTDRTPVFSPTQLTGTPAVQNGDFIDALVPTLRVSGSPLEFFRVSLARIDATSVAWFYNCGSRTIRNSAGAAVGPYSVIGRVVNEADVHSATVPNTGPFIILASTIGRWYGESVYYWIDGGDSDLLVCRGNNPYYLDDDPAGVIDGAGADGLIYDLQTPTITFTLDQRSVLTATHLQSGTQLFDLSHLEGYPAFHYRYGTVGARYIADVENWNENDIMVTISPAGQSVAGGMSEAMKFYYKASLMYDGFQESPLSAIRWSSYNAAGVTSNKRLRLRVPDPAPFSRRVTHIVLYRAEGQLDEDVPETLYRYVEAIPLLNWTPFTQTTGPDFFEYSVHDSGTIGASYEARTGLPETITNITPQYGLAEQMNGRLFIGQVAHPDLPEASHMIFRSKSFRYDTFNWLEDNLRMPDPPVAITSFGGRVFIFSRSNMYKVNPDGMFVEDIYDGYGVEDQTAVTSNDVGLFFANRNNVFKYDGRTITPLGYPILFNASGNSEVTAWEDLAHETTPLTGFHPILAYSNKHDALLIYVCYTIPGATGWATRIFSYHLTKQRWDVWNSAAVDNAHAGVIVDSLGQVYVSSKGAFTSKLATHASLYTPWTWISKRFTMDTPDQVKKFYMAKVDSSGLVAIYYSLDGGAWALMTSEDLPGGSSGTDWMGKSLQLKATSSDGTGVLHGLAIVFRRLIGLR